MGDTDRLGHIEARLAAIEANQPGPTIYVVLSNIRNVEAFRSREMAERRVQQLDPGNLRCPATACLFDVPLA